LQSYDEHFNLYHEHQINISPSTSSAAGLGSLQASPAWNLMASPVWNLLATPAWNMMASPVWNLLASPAWQPDGWPTIHLP
jgi:hypothetical protein